MKRGWIGVCLSLTLALSLTVPALAAEGDPAIEITPNGEGYNVTVTGDNVTANDQYVLLILKAGATPANLQVGDILYIDQVGGGAGTAAFQGLQLRTKQSADVYIGGTNLNSPVASLVDKDHPDSGTGIYVDGVTVSGKIVFSGTKTPARVVITDAQSAQVGDVTTSASGTFEVSATTPGAAYTLTASKIGHLSHTKSIQVDEAMDIGTITLLAGDVNNSGGIDVDDLSAILADYGKKQEGATIPGCDVDETGDINVDDLSLLLSNYGKENIVD